MPRPPVLPVLDWRRIFESGVDFRKWLEQADSAENRGRMEEIYKTLQLAPAREALLKALPRTVHVLAIAEDWCGDVVRFAPVIAHLALLGGEKVFLRFVSREQHPDVFARFLTNGGEAIPKFVFLNDQFVECGNWGPMPYECRKVLSRGKGANDIAAARARVRKLYESDPNFEAAQAELMDLIETAVCTRP